MNNTVQCEPTSIKQPQTMPTLKYQEMREYMKIDEDNRIVPPHQWKAFQFECTHINIIAEACVGVRRHMIFEHVTACRKIKKETFDWLSNSRELLHEQEWLM